MEESVQPHTSEWFLLTACQDGGVLREVQLSPSQPRDLSTHELSGLVEQGHESFAWSQLCSTEVGSAWL